MVFVREMQPMQDIWAVLGLEKIAEHEGHKEHWDGNIELGVGPVIIVMWILCTWKLM